MTVFDILSQMEAYAQAFPAMNTIISVMDRSLPYEAASGSYNTPEKSDVRYLVDEFLTSERGFSSVDTAGKTVLEIALDGDEIVSVDGSVFHLAEGRFLIYQGDSSLCLLEYLIECYIEDQQRIWLDSSGPCLAIAKCWRYVGFD